MKIKNIKDKKKKRLKTEGNNNKSPTWTQSQMYQAIDCVIKQQLRFTQASVKFGIPKGTLYDNILGKSSRMKVLDLVGLTEKQELQVLEYCCEVSLMPFNRRTSHSLESIRDFVVKLKHEEGEKSFEMNMKLSFQWWWAFTKKHNIISLYYNQQ